MEFHQEFLPGYGYGIALAKVRKYVVDIIPEHGIERHEAHLVRAQGISFLVKEICNTLEKYGSLATSCDTVYKENGNIRVSDDGVLLLLNGGGYGLHLVRSGLRKRCKKHRVFNCNLSIKICI